MVKVDIPVLDDPSTLDRLKVHRRKPRVNDSWNGLYIFIFILTVIVFTQTLIEFSPILFRLGVIARYTLWLSIFAGLSLHIVRRGVSNVMDGLAPVLAFLTIGMISATLSNEPHEAAQVLTFWILGVLAAITIGAELRSEILLSVLFWTFAFLIVSSVAAALIFPSFGTQIDGRALAGHAWRGLVPNKNGFGYLTAFSAVAFCLMPGRHWALRSFVIVLTIMCAVLSSSQGGLITLAAAFSYLFIVHLIYQIRSSALSRATVLFIIISVAALSVNVLSGYLLELAGRDAGLTGRSVIWPAYFNRALEHWLIGAGPGTFSQASSITADVGASFSKYGEIHTPHNMYIAAFGEVGLLGAISFFGALAYFVFYAPFIGKSRLGYGTGACAFILVIGGLGETREVFGTGISMFLILTFYSSLKSNKRASTSPIDSDVPVIKKTALPVLA
ncbi:O-antigen ligase family protein [Sphingomonas sp. Leaf343]|uniref:O-antigen ligase family protein n=1 Tax=Sphingomonas sp. Leaf343 TaxID=1736345 RepID=UPI0009E93A47|nr:O-antigen ligase family protein [Sphingomonas sp. Leaf343]